jgi:hypothetical protein
MGKIEEQAVSKRDTFRWGDRLVKYWAVVTTVVAVTFGFVLFLDRAKVKLYELVPRVDAIECKDMVRDERISKLEASNQTYMASINQTLSDIRQDLRAHMNANGGG